jgi:hypothetical protein
MRSLLFVTAAVIAASALSGCCVQQSCGVGGSCGGPLVGRLGMDGCNSCGVATCDVGCGHCDPCEQPDMLDRLAIWSGRARSGCCGCAGSGLGTGRLLGGCLNRGGCNEGCDGGCNDNCGCGFAGGDRLRSGMASFGGRMQSMGLRNRCDCGAANCPGSDCDGSDCGCGQPVAQAAGCDDCGSDSIALASGTSDGIGCGRNGCGTGGRLCLGCQLRSFGRGGQHGLRAHGARRHPYGGVIPHTPSAELQGQGPITPAYAYPYYTTRGPRDFLVDNPPSIGQ